MSLDLQGHLKSDFEMPITGRVDETYFFEVGFKKLLRAMLKQSLKDIVLDRSDPDASAEVSLSARWPKSDAGRESLQFLMPSVSVHHIVAKIYQDPDAFLQALNSVEVEADASSKVHQPYGLFGYGLAEAQARAALQNSHPVDLQGDDEDGDGDSGSLPSWPQSA